MSKREYRINFLAKKWKSGKITEDELSEFESWYHSFDDSKKIVDHVSSEEELKQRIFYGIEAEMRIDRQNAKPLRNTSAQNWKIAASILMIVGLSAILIYYSQTSSVRNSLATTELTQQYDVVAGNDKAILIMGDGRQVVLENEESIFVADAKGSKILSDNGKVISRQNRSTNIPDSEILYSTIVTPSSGQFQVILPDGTHVWLNAESSLKFPNDFKGNKRQVTLSGEGYFEVAKDKSKPFEVITERQRIEVLGTHFNVNAYPNEKNMKTTLLEGKVRLAIGSESVMLQPGQEGIISRNPLKSDKIILREADVQETIAWKNGLFDFKDADVGTIMRSIARWYNVEIEYIGESSRKKFSGRVYRNVNLQEFLSILNYSGINAVLEKSDMPSKKGKIVVR